MENKKEQKKELGKGKLSTMQVHQVHKFTKTDALTQCVKLCFGRENTYPLDCCLGMYWGNSLGWP